LNPGFRISVYRPLRRTLVLHQFYSASIVHCRYSSVRKGQTGRKGRADEVKFQHTGERNIQQPTQT